LPSVRCNTKTFAHVHHFPRRNDARMDCENDGQFPSLCVAKGDAHSTHREAAFGGSARNYLAALVYGLDRPDVAMNRASRRARPNVIDRALRHASTAVVRNSAAAVLKVWRVFIVHHEAQAFRSLWCIMDREARRSSATSSIPDHEKLALKADASYVEVSTSKAEKPRA
jgi:hypothetical protein